MTLQAPVEAFENRLGNGGNKTAVDASSNTKTRSLASSPMEDAAERSMQMDDDIPQFNPVSSRQTKLSKKSSVGRSKAGIHKAWRIRKARAFTLSARSTSERTRKTSQVFIESPAMKDVLAQIALLGLE